MKLVKYYTKCSLSLKMLKIKHKFPIDSKIVRIEQVNLNIFSWTYFLI